MDEVHANDDDRHEAVDELLERQIEASSTPEVAKRTLRRVNKIRRRFGAEPLLDLRKGIPGHSHNCPIYNSLKDMPLATCRLVQGSVVLESEESVERGYLDQVREAINGDEVDVYTIDVYGFAISCEEFAEFVRLFDSPDINIEGQDIDDIDITVGLALQNRYASQL